MDEVLGAVDRVDRERVLGLDVAVEGGRVGRGALLAEDERVRERRRQLAGEDRLGLLVGDGDEVARVLLHHLAVGQRAEPRRDDLRRDGLHQVEHLVGVHDPTVPHGRRAKRNQSAPTRPLRPAPTRPATESLRDRPGPGRVGSFKDCGVGRECGQRRRPRGSSASVAVWPSTGTALRVRARRSSATCSRAGSASQRGCRATPLAWRVTSGGGCGAATASSRPGRAATTGHAAATADLLRCMSGDAAADAALRGRVCRLPVGSGALCPAGGPRSWCPQRRHGPRRPGAARCGGPCAGTTWSTSGPSPGGRRSPPPSWTSPRAARRSTRCPLVARAVQKEVVSVSRAPRRAARTAAGPPALAVLRSGPGGRRGRRAERCGAPLRARRGARPRPASRGVAVAVGRRESTAGTTNEYTAYRLIVEVDGRLGHEQWSDRVRDGRRDRQLLGQRPAPPRGCSWADVAVTPCQTAPTSRRSWSLAGGRYGRPCRRPGARWACLGGRGRPVGPPGL